MASIWRVTTLYSGGAITGPGINRLYFSESVTSGDAQSAVAAFYTSLTANIVNTITFTISGQVEEINDATGDITGVEDTDVVTVTGANAQDNLPLGTSLVAQLFTNTFINGRRLRGRIYLPGFVEPNNAAGVPDATIKTAVKGYLGTLHDGGANGLLVYSPTHGLSSSVTKTDVNPKWGLLHSRRD